MTSVSVRRTKRRPLTCTACLRRKVRCDKAIPCSNCVKKGLGDECQREPVVVRGKLVNTGPEETPEVPGLVQHPEFFRENYIENIRWCVEMLTVGFIKVDSLFRVGYESDVNWVDFHQKFKHLMARMEYSSSKAICLFSCQYINFIHNGVVPSIFMEEHQTFWENHVKQDPQCLLYFEDSRAQRNKPRDYYFWMSMYYITICNGIYFGSSELARNLPFSEDELHNLAPTFFKASYECLLKAQFLNSPDIRSVQIFCMMSTCFHAYGSVGLLHSLLRQVVQIANSLKFEKVAEVENMVDFHSEVKKRLWYTLCIIDWLSLSAKSVIEYEDMPLPKLITESQLREQNAASGEYSTVFYQHVMIKMSKIKRKVNQKPSRRHLIAAWHALNDLRDTSVEFYEKKIPPSEETLSYDYAGFLLFSSLSEEVLDLGRKILSVIGKEEWARKFRKPCVEVAMSNLARASLNVPTYYRRHWIIIQHHTCAALFVLLDTIMFPEESATEEESYKLNQIEKLFHVFEEFKNTHVPARLGLAIIPRLCKLVKFVRVEKNEANVFEEISLRHYLDDLLVNWKPETNPLPAVGQLQYMRLEDTRDLRKANITEELLNTLDLYDLLADTGWYEVLENVFGANT